MKVDQLRRRGFFTLLVDAATWPLAPAGAAAGATASPSMIHERRCSLATGL
jgi:hypothetical protein